MVDYNPVAAPTGEQGYGAFDHDTFNPNVSARRVIQAQKFVSGLSLGSAVASATGSAFDMRFSQKAQARLTVSGNRASATLEGSYDNVNWSAIVPVTGTVAAGQTALFEISGAFGYIRGGMNSASGVAGRSATMTWEFQLK